MKFRVVVEEEDEVDEEVEDGGTAKEEMVLRKEGESESEGMFTELGLFG